jgi:hypothetical protein
MSFELPEQVAANIDRFTGRTWLLPILLEWWEHTDERLFLLIGDPGTGKSMILAWLGGFGPPPIDPSSPFVQEQRAQLRQLVKAVHFCQANSFNISPQAFAEGIANQLTSTVPGFGDALVATLAERVSIVGTVQAGTAAPGSSLTGVSIGRIDLGSLGDEPSFDRAFTQPLKKLYAGGHTEPMLLLVDALDEAQSYTGVVTVPDLLHRLRDLPGGVRIVATTRDDPEVMKFFDGIRRLDLVVNAPPGVDDVQAYTGQRLEQLTALDDVMRNDFAGRLAKQADGVFLYAARVLDELLERPLSNLPDLNTYPLPTGLSGIYRDFLLRKIGKNLWSDRYKLLLGLVAVAQGGLTSTELAGITKRYLDEIQDALRECKQYLSGELPDGPFRLFHKSLADFLLEDKDNRHYHIDAASMHSRIVQHYLNSYHNCWEACDVYGLENLAFHMRSAGRAEDLVELVKAPSWYQARRDKSGQISPYLSDVGHAWDATELLNYQQATETPSVHLLIHGEIDCALIVSSFKSTIPPPRLLAALLKEHLVSSNEALEYALGMSDSQAKASALAELASLLDDSFIPALLTAAFGQNEEAYQVEVLSALANRLSVQDRNAVLQNASRMKDDFWKGELISALAPFLTLDEIKAAYTIACSLPIQYLFNFVRDGAITTLVRRLAQLGRIQDAKNYCDTVSKKHCRVLCLSGIVPFLSPSERVDATLDGCKVAETIEDDFYRRDAFLSLRSHILNLGEPDRSEWEATSRLAIHVPEDCGVAAPIASILRFVNDLPQSEQVASLEMALAALQHLSLTHFRTRELYIQLEVEFARRGLISTALQIAAKYGDFRLYLLAYLDGDEKASVLADCEKWMGYLDKAERLAVLPLLTDAMPSENRRRKLQAALMESGEIADNQSLAQAAADILPHVAELGLVDDAIGMSKSLPANLRCRALIEITARSPDQHPDLKATLLRQALTAAETIDLSAKQYSDIEQEELLSALIKPLADVGCYEEAFSIIRRLPRSSRIKTAALKAAKTLARAPSQALEFCLGYEKPASVFFEYSALLAEVVSQLSLSELRSLSQLWSLGDEVKSAACIRFSQLGDLDIALQQLETIEDPYWQAMASIGMLADASDELKHPMVEKALLAGEKVEGLKKIKVLSLVAKHVGAKQYDEVHALIIDEAKKLRLSPDVVKELRALGLEITKPMLETALYNALSSSNKYYLKHLIPELPEELLGPCDRFILQKVSNDYDRDQLRCEIIIRLAKLGHTDLALDKFRSLSRIEFRAQAVAQLGGNLNQVQINSLLEFALDIDERGNGQWRALAFEGLVAHLVEFNAFERIVTAACSLSDANWRNRALRAVSSRIAGNVRLAVEIE